MALTAGVGGFLGFHLHGRRLVGQRTDESVAVAILGDSDRHFRFNDGVDSANCVFEEDVVARVDG